MICAKCSNFGRLFCYSSHRTTECDSFIPNKSLENEISLQLDPIQRTFLRDLVQSIIFSCEAELGKTYLSLKDQEKNNLFWEFRRQMAITLYGQLKE
jgi:hypothetical protein